MLAKDWAAWAASLAEDGVILPPDSGPIHGPAAAVNARSAVSVALLLRIVPATFVTTTL